MYCIDTFYNASLLSHLCKQSSKILHLLQIMALFYLESLVSFALNYIKSPYLSNYLMHSIETWYNLS